MLNQMATLKDEHEAKLQELNKKLELERKLRLCADAAVSL